MYSIALCDNDPIHLVYSERIIRSRMSKYPSEIDTFPSAEALLQCMSTGDYAPDIAVLDIDLGGMDGIMLAKELNRIAPHCKIIFLTNYIEFASNAYFVEHTWFILKSDIEKYIGPALEKAIVSLSALSTDGVCIPGIVVKIGSRISMLPVSAVLYTELVGRKTRIVAEEGEVFSSKSPKELLANIPNCKIIRCHQSFYVNVSKIISIDANDLLLSSGARIPVSRTYKSAVKAAFFSTLLGNPV